MPIDKSDAWNNSGARADRLRMKALRKAERKRPLPWEERRAQLLMIAREIINDEGIGALTMSALADRSGASKPVVYEHFDNREEVAIQLMDESYRKITNYVAERVAASTTIYEYLDIVIKSLFQIQELDKFRVRSITNGFSSSSEVNDFYLLQQKNTHSIIMDLLCQQEIPESECNLAAYTLMIMMNETVAQYVDNKNPVDIVTLQRMVNGAIRGLLPENLSKPKLSSDILNTIERVSSRSKSKRR